VEKKETNHWWKGYLLAGGEACVINAGLLIIPWEIPIDDLAPSDVVSTEAHLCGEQHVAEWVSRNLTSKPTPKEASSEVASQA